MFSKKFATVAAVRRTRPSGGALAALAAAPVPVPAVADIDMDELGPAIGADTAAARHGADIFRQRPLGDTRDPDIGRLAGHVLGPLGTAHPPVIGRRPVTRRYDRLLAELSFKPVKHGDQFGFQALDPDLGMLGHETPLGVNQPRPCIAAALDGLFRRRVSRYRNTLAALGVGEARRGRARCIRASGE